MAIEHLQRLVVAEDTQANIEAAGFDLGELIFGLDTDTNVLGFSADGGTTWYWATSGAAEVAANQLTTRWEPLTNGNPSSPALVFDPSNGDVFMVEVAQ